MQDINLLQNKLKDNASKWETNNRVVTVLLVLVLIGLLLAAGSLFMLTKSAKDNTVTLNQNSADLNRQLSELEVRLAAAKGFQAQTKNINTLLANHVVWNVLVDELAKTTFKGSRYMSITGSTTGTIHIEGITQSYTSLGKLLLSLETSQQFQSVKLLSISPSEDELAGILYAIEVKVKQDIFISRQ